MPTLPPVRPDSAEQSPHEARAIAESFGTDAESYDRTRPRYPEALVRAIVEASIGREVLDVGCGTGIATQQLQAAGCRVLGVDVDARMAEFASRHGVREVEVASFEEWDPAGRRFDLVTGAQAWHWVDPVIGARKAATILRPSGRLALLWKVMQFPPSLAAAFSAVYRSTGLPHFAQGEGGLAAYRPILEAAEQGVKVAGRFDPPERWHFDWQRAYQPAEWIAQFLTFGGHNQLRPEERDRLVSGLSAAIEAAGGIVRVDYTSVVVTSRRDKKA